MGPKDLSENMAPPHGLSDCPSYILMPQFEEFEGVPFKQTHVDERAWKNNQTHLRTSHTHTYLNTREIGENLPSGKLT